jgi:hypothetical protein
MGVVAHYTDNIFKNRIIMIALKRLHETHSGENIGSLLIEIINNFDLKERLGYFVTNNASSNDTCVYHIFTSFLSDLSKIQRTQYRLRYFGYILNLACGSYLYGHDPDFFEIEIIVFKSLTREQEELKI